MQRNKNSLLPFPLHLLLPAALILSFPLNFLLLLIQILWNRAPVFCSPAKGWVQGQSLRGSIYYRQVRGEEMGGARTH